MKKLSLKQEATLSDFFNQLAVATIAGGGITAIIDKSLSFILSTVQFLLFLVAGMAFLVISLLIRR